MLMRISLAALAAAVIFWFWGFIWFGLSPMAAITTQPLPAAGAAAIEALRASGISSGSYFFPDATNPNQIEMINAFATGPLVMIHMTQGGAAVPDPMVMLLGFLHFFVSALLVGYLVSRAGHSLPGFPERWGFIILFGVASAVFSRLGTPIWFVLPFDHFLWYGVYDVLGWTLSGAAMAKILRTE